MKYFRDEKAIKKFGARVKYIRQSQKLTQKQLAFEVGISDTQIRRIEKGTINTSLSVIIGIASSFQINLKDLFDY